MSQTENALGFSEESREVLDFVPHLMQEFGTFNGQPLTLEPWQEYIVQGLDPWIWCNKCRQGGFSLAGAIRTFGRSQLLPDKSYTGVFLSYNQYEAAEKIRYVQALYEGFPSDKRVKRKIDNTLEQEWENGNRIISYPCRAVRGPQNVDLIGDEVAHWREAEKVWTGSRPATIRGGWGGVGGSTPFGLNFFKIGVNECGKSGTPFSNFKLLEVPWWKSAFLCKDVSGASLFAAQMQTEDAVREFGTSILIEEFQAYPLEIFQQEYCGHFFDSVNSVFTEDVILACSNGELPTELLNIDCTDERIQVEELLKITIDSLRYRGITAGYLGFDVGRERNASEIQIVAPHDTSSIATRFFLTLHQAPFPLQRRCLKYLMENLPVKKMAIDSNGIGREIAEWAEAEFGAARVIRATFNPEQKAEMVATLQRFFEAKEIWIFPTRRLHAQLLAVKKITTAKGKQIYDSETGKEAGGYTHHADLFWALAMAVYAYASMAKKTVRYTTRGPQLGLHRNTLIPSSLGRSLRTR